jgi:hypothetical protein
MTKTRDEILENRRLLRAEYGKLFDAMAVLLYRHDPIGINFEDNTDEYEPEVGTILPRLHSCHSADGVLHVVHAEFVRWFDSDTAGPPERYKEIALEIWQLWQGHLADKPSPDLPSPTLSAGRAVMYGHLTVNLPVIFIIGLGGLLGYFYKGPAGVWIGLLLGILPAWLWWSAVIPRWREWAKLRGADELQTQRLGERSGLVWPKGSVFEKTEFKIRKGT